MEVPRRQAVLPLLHYITTVKRGNSLLYSLNRKHVAEIGGWSLRQVQKWCADGTLPAMMIGGTWAISGQKICDMLGIED